MMDDRDCMLMALEGIGDVFEIDNPFIYFCINGGIF